MNTVQALFALALFVALSYWLYSAGYVSGRDEHPRTVYDVNRAWIARFAELAHDTFHREAGPGWHVEATCGKDPMMRTLYLSAWRFSHGDYGQILFAGSRKINLIASNEALSVDIKIAAIALAQSARAVDAKQHAVA